MNRRRSGTALLVGAVLLSVLVEPALAQTSSSVTEELIWDLNLNLLYIAVPITVLVEGILIYTVLRFRKNEDPLPTRENRRLEITWTIATAVILLVVGVGSYQVLGNEFVAGAQAGGTEAIEELEEDPVVVEVTAMRYGWEFQYTDFAANTSQELSENNTLTTRGTLYLPTDRPVQLEITSSDWIHSFHVPDLGLKQDAMPGQWNRLLTKINEPGGYQLYCAEYCGSGHSNMLGTVEVLSEENFEEQLASEQSS
jgi:cytochrome c oxidase subunit 2